MKRQSRVEVTSPGNVTVIPEAGEPYDFSLNEIQIVRMFKMDLLSTDLVCAEIGFSRDGHLWWGTIDEETPGYGPMMAELAQLPGFRSDWRDAVIQPPFAENLTIVFERKA